MAQNQSKAARWNLRVAPDADEIVRQAASVSHRNLSEFVLQAAVSEAERVLADRTRFVLDDEAWEQFTELLNRPARSIPALAELFARSSALD